jgi:hypothetical protein
MTKAVFYEAVLFCAAMVFSASVIATPPDFIPPGHQYGGNTSAGGTASAVGGSATGTVMGGNVTHEVNQRAFGGGSTGLTGSAKCLGSFGLLFNALSFTYQIPSCLAEAAALEHCKTEDCRRAVTCANPDIPEYAKVAIGCKE